MSNDYELISSTSGYILNAIFHGSIFIMIIAIVLTAIGATVVGITAVYTFRTFRKHNFKNLIQKYDNNVHIIESESGATIDIKNNLTTKVVSNTLRKESEIDVNKSEDIDDDYAETNVAINVDHDGKKRSEGTQSLNDYGYHDVENM